MRKIKIKAKCQMNNHQFSNIEHNSNKLTITINYSKVKRKLLTTIKKQEEILYLLS